MQRKKLAKRFGIASLFLTAAISAFSGIALLDNNVAVADEIQTIQTTNFVHTNVAADKVTRDENGLRISSNEAYTATFKTVFTENTTVKFKFPEVYNENLGFYGDFKFRITDATDDSKFFDIIYYVQSSTAFRTTPYIKWGDETRTSVQTGGAWHNDLDATKTAFNFAPCFLTKGAFAAGDANGRDGGREGILSLVWQNDILYVLANTNHSTRADYMTRIAKFDGTYDTSKMANGFEDQLTWGLPSMNFANGYTITVSSEITAAGVTDKATDVLISSIESKGTSAVDISAKNYLYMTSLKATYGASYDFKTKTALTKDDYMETFDQSFIFLTTTQAETGKYFLGWRNPVTNKLYPAYSVVKKQADASYDAVVLGFDILDGASVRVDTSEYSRSGIRFQTTFDVDEYEVAKAHIQSFGTLVAWTDTLTKGDFTIKNYQGKAAFAQVQNTKGTYEYIDEKGEKYTAYSMAVYVDPDHFMEKYSARGYLIVEYADGSTKTMYTDYNATDNSRRIAEVAYQYKTDNPDVYSAMSQAQKDVIDAFIATYVEFMSKS